MPGIPITCGGGSGAIQAHAGTELERGWLGKFPGVEGELLRWLEVAMGLWCGQSAAAQRFCAAELGFGAVLEWVMGRRGPRGCF